METDVIADEIKLAMRTLKHMPPDGPGRLRAAWPDVFHDPHETYGWHPATLNRYIPTPEEIKRMDVVLYKWFPRLTDYERVLVSGRGAGYSWRKLMRICRKKLSLGHDAHKRNHRRVMGKLSRLHTAGTLGLTPLNY